MELRHLRYFFVAVADELNLTRAAKNYSLPSHP